LLTDTADWGMSRVFDPAILTNFYTDITRWLPENTAATSQCPSIYNQITAFIAQLIFYGAEAVFKIRWISPPECRKR
jgi:hypothetical protein